MADQNFPTPGRKADPRGVLEALKTARPAPTPEARKLQELEELGESFGEAVKQQEAASEKVVEPKKAKPKKEKDGDDFDFTSVEYSNTPFDNRKTRARIEERVEPFDLSDLIKGKIKQKVPINPKYLIVIYSTIPPGMYKLVDELLDDAMEKKLIKTDRYGHDFLQQAHLALHVEQINDMVLPDIRVMDDLEDQMKSFRERLDIIKKTLPADWVMAMIANMTWFRNRVQTMLQEEDVVENF